jgi:hypothetical protein
MRAAHTAYLIALVLITSVTYGEKGKATPVTGSGGP